jgi:hypothetical protein
VAAPAAAPRRAVYWPLALVAPVIALIIAPGLLYTDPAWIDPWVYLGYMRNFAAFKGSLFPGTYYGSRLSWLLPGVLAHGVLPAVVANAVLHLGVFAVAIFSLYFLLARSVGRRCAALTAMCAGSYPYLWAAAGWDYVDGPGIAYYLLTLAVMFAAARSRRGRLLLICAGAAHAGLIYSNITWVFFSPTVPALYFWTRRADGRQITREDLKRFAIWFGIGWLAVSLVLGAINYAVEGTIWFYGPSIMYSVRTIGQANPWTAPNHRWIETAYWLAFPAAAAVASLWVLLQNGRRKAKAASAMTLFFAANLLYTNGVLVYMEFVLRRPALELWFYASYAIPASFLALGAVLFGDAEFWTKQRFRIGACGAAFVAALVWCPVGFWDWKGVPDAIGWTTHGAGIALLVAALAVRGRRAFLPLALSGLTLIYMPPWTVIARLERRPEAYRRIVAAVDVVAQAREGRPVRFWYSAGSPFGDEYNAVNGCYLWGYTYVGRAFPALEGDAKVLNGALLVVPSTEQDVSAVAAAALGPHGQELQPIARRRIEAAGRGYWLHLFEVKAAAVAPRKD